MMMKKTIGLRQRGIGLLELMLSLAIIAILLIMATRYYQSASSGQKISEATDMYAAVKSAVNNYMNNSKNVFPSSIYTLVQNDYLPNSYAASGISGVPASKNINPWGGAVNIGQIQGAALFYVTMTGIPDTNTCNQIVSRLASTLLTANNEGMTQSSTPTATICQTSITSCTGTPPLTLSVCYSQS